MTNKRVLIADDSRSMLAFLSQSLAKLGFNEIDDVNDGFEAFNLIRSRGYSLIILDHDMPGLKGIDILRKLKPAKLPIILVTGHVDSEMIRIIKGEGLHVCSVISKPFKFETLEQKVGAIPRPTGLKPIGLSV